MMAREMNDVAVRSAGFAQQYARDWGEGIVGVDSDQVVSTVRYDAFVYDPRNRPIDEKHVEELFDSISVKNLLADFPIVVERRGSHLVVLDGQHRLEVAKIMEVPIFYKVSDTMTFSDVDRINSSTKGWDNQDYLNRWVREGRPEYIKFRNFLNKYPHVGLNFGMTLCSQGISGSVRKAFKNGSYAFNNEEMAERVGEAALTMKKYAPDFWAHKHFLVALRALLSNPRYSHETMLRKLDYQTGRLRKCADSAGYIDNLLQIYNYKSRSTPLTMDGVVVRRGKTLVE